MNWNNAMLQSFAALFTSNSPPSSITDIQGKVVENRISFDAVANEDNTQAMYEQASELYSDDNPKTSEASKKQAVKDFKIAAERGHSGAMFQLGIEYTERVKAGFMAGYFDTEYNTKQALSYLTDAVANGNEDAADYIIDTALHINAHVKGINITDALLRKSVYLLVKNNVSSLDIEKCQKLQTLIESKKSQVNAEFNRLKHEAATFTGVARYGTATLDKDYISRNIRPWEKLDSVLEARISYLQQSPSLSFYYNQL